ncbi:hypothetical protein [Streptomyces sp. NBC_01205]|uniref:hypothetical protein n=1 Tax=Streptomyces sp. NBC_01205 TaxID=2903771 RepID=UPI002E0F0C80|nr:hypothetical protein OG573_36365 [Streptomyces sp. NBC_01205]
MQHSALVLVQPGQALTSGPAVATTLAMALLVWLWGAYGAVRLTHRWRPTAD